MTRGQRAAGWFPGDTPERRPYAGYPQAARLELFAKDREIRRLGARLAAAESALEFIRDVASGKVGGNDLPWIAATIKESIDRYDLRPGQHRDIGPVTSGEQTSPEAPPP